jgi:hypothetical protein
MSGYDDYVSGRVDARYEAFLKRTADPDLVESRSTRRELVAKVIVLRDRCLEAEAALAERDRMLEDMQMEYLQAALNHGFSIPTLAQRRARAK